MNITAKYNIGDIVWICKVGSSNLIEKCEITGIHCEQSLNPDKIGPIINYNIRTKKNSSIFETKIYEQHILGTKPVIVLNKMFINFSQQYMEDIKTVAKQLDIPVDKVMKNVKYGSLLSIIEEEEKDEKETEEKTKT